MSGLETYLSELRERRNRVKDETGNYDILLNLLNEVGSKLKPKVKAVGELKNKGADNPDMGFFVDKSKDEKPTNGAIEVKKTSIKLDKTLSSDQVVKKYLPFYKVVFVTNYYQFALLTENENEEAQLEERFNLAENEAEFWELTKNPRKAAEKYEAALKEYLSRVMQRTTPINKPEDVAKLLASYAREAKAILEKTDNKQSLAQIRIGLQNALDTTFEGEKGEQFFLSTLVQTLFYGMFSSWVLWHGRTEDADAKFNWLEERDNSNIPVISQLFFHLSNRKTLEALGIKEILEWTTDALNRVKRQKFFKDWDTNNAIQYFYEPFLQAFDPELRKELGVWYTPNEIVKYMVARVEQTLQAEWGLSLADDDVYILDPCCGTGAYLVEVLKHIYHQAIANGEGDNAGKIARKAIQERIFGFEILPSPFVVAHLQIALLLSVWGAPMTDNERAKIYLTNALTDWEQSKKAETTYMFPELQEEVEASQSVKRGRKVMVVLGNPPYNAFAGTSPKEEGDLVQIYKQGLIEEWGIKKYNLDDLYIRFFRIAERAISEINEDKQGIVSYISNSSWITEPSFVVLRQNLLQSFDEFWIENMHGNRKSSEVAPDGKPSQSVFAVRGLSSGIEQGTVISLWIRRGLKAENSNGTVYHRDNLDHSNATQRREALLESLDDPNVKKHYRKASPNQDNRYSLRPMKIREEYLTWTKVSDLAIKSSNGLMEKRGNSLISIERETLEKRIQDYFDPNVSWEDLVAMNTGLTRNAAGYDALAVRTKTLSKELSSEIANIHKYSFRPFDNRYAYYSQISTLWNRPRPDLWTQYKQGNEFLISRLKPTDSNEKIAFYHSKYLVDDHALPTDARCFPFYLYKTSSKTKTQQMVSFLPTEFQANLSSDARKYLADLGIGELDSNRDHAALIWLHALAIGYSTEYNAENQDGLASDYPRIPLPKDKDLLFTSAALGRKVADLLDMDKKVQGVTNVPNEEIAKIAVAHEQSDNTPLSGWGRPNRNGIGATEGRILKNGNSYDVYFNKTNDARWENIPKAVWEYRIGGYPVLSKWLSYRDERFLGRALKNPDETREFMQIARRIAALINLEAELDKNYQAVVESASQ